MEEKKITRLYSLDALRGFDMFWIMGGEGIFHALKNLTGWSWAAWISLQLDHVEWNGFHFYDMIFPLFLFLSGMTMPFSLGRQLEKGIPKKDILLKVVKRSLILIALGMLYNGINDLNISHIRFASVLAQIGIAYFFAALIFLNTDWKKQILWVIGILLSYWAILALIPVPGIGANILTKEGCLNGYIDRLFLPGRLYEGIFDPEGILVKFPAIATALLGGLLGQFVKMPDIKGYKKVGYMLIAFIILNITAQVWDLAFPINKKLWTSSFVLCTASWSVLLFAIFYLIIDVLDFKKWAFPLTVIGMNSITIYLGNAFIDFGYTTKYLLGWLLSITHPAYQLMLFAFLVVLVEWIVLYFLYKRGIFLKV